MSEGTTRKSASHPIRLAVLMLLGAYVGSILAPAVGDMLDPWHRAAPYTHAIVGSLAGLAIELCVRYRISIEFLIAIIASGVLAIAWAVVH
jgi:hypothetical protein